MRHRCSVERRREAILASNGLPDANGINTLNGIDHVEVLDALAPTPADAQRILRVHFLLPPNPGLRAIGPRDVRIQGGLRITDLQVVSPITFDLDVLVLRLDRSGDHSTYTLRFVGPDGSPLPGLDPLLASVDFSFKVECPSDLDCRADCFCPADASEAPEIDYLARDYHSFRQLMLDRMSVTMPSWRERNVADLGVAMVEALAYAADHLSYQLDAVGMESSLRSARRRTSAKRHARLVDYTMHEGANARTWAHVVVDPGSQDVALPRRTRLMTRVSDVALQVADGTPEFRHLLQQDPVVFETMVATTLQGTLNTLRFYTWGDRACCLPVGATSATLVGRLDRLRKGDHLAIVEALGPLTGRASDADQAHRHVVRLTADPILERDPLGSWFVDPNAPIVPVDVTRIEWAADDALPFPLCVSATTELGYRDDVSIAHGNLVLCDHGLTLDPERLPVVPQPDERLSVATGGAACGNGELLPAPPRYHPRLKEAPLTWTGSIGRALPGTDPRRWAGFDPAAPATAALRWQQEQVIPAIHLIDERTGQAWHPRRDLLASTAFSPEFVVEIDPDGHARLRFGDGEYGQRPASGARFSAVYRVGNGSAGNIGANSLYHIASVDPRILGVDNPLPARGGTEPETLEHVRQMAPEAFRVPQRAVTPEDYALVAQRHPEVQRALATERYTGSWSTIFLTIDRGNGLPVDPDFEAEIRAFLERYRMAAHDLEIDAPRPAPLELRLHVCVLPDHQRSDVKQAVLQVLGAGLLPDGRPAMFHPDALGFGQTIHLSAILAAAQRVPGVLMVEAKTFRRLGDLTSTALADGKLTVARLEVPVLDNNPSTPERGVLTLELEGGR